jgi:hypothetical protein
MSSAAVLRRYAAGGELQLTVQEVEEARVSQLDPEPSAVEVGERDKKLGHGRLLTAEEAEEAG